MPLTNFPNGVSSFGMPVVGSGDGKIPITFTGTYFYVSSVIGNAAYSGTDPSQPLATIQQALNKCTSGAGDVIILLRGHSETYTSASQLTVSKADVTIVGSSSEGTSRAKITMGTAATATILISAANVTFKNISFESAIDDCATVFVVEGKYFTCDGCSFLQSAVNKNFLTLVKVGVSTTANVADGFKWINNYRNEIDSAATADISFLANTDNALIANNYSNTTSTADVGHFIIAAALVLISVRVLNNIVLVNGANSSQSVGIMFTSSATTDSGVFAGNLVASLDTTGALISTAGTGVWFLENYLTGAADKSGAVWPVADNPA